jgi:polysaccharide export outer membrane protein
MSKLRYLGSAVTFVLLAWGSLAWSEDQPSVSAAAPDYLIAPGDVLEISVWKEEELQRKEVVRPGGALSFPLVGNIQAAGKTVGEVQKEITERLSRYIPEPVVSVTVLETLGNTFYVIGKVNKPGEFSAGRYIDIMQALSLAGGLTPFAHENRIKVLRRQNGKVQIFPFDYNEVKRGDNLEQNIILKGGDTVVVP